MQLMYRLKLCVYPEIEKTVIKSLNLTTDAMVIFTKSYGATLDCSVLASRDFQNNLAGADVGS